MANKSDKDLKITIGTEADTKGLEETAEKTDKVTEATEKLTKAEKERAQESGRPDDRLAEIREITAAEEEALQKQREADVEKAKALKKIREEGEEANKTFDKLFDQQRMLANVAQFRALAAEVGNLARSFSQTEKGQQMLSQLPEGLRVFGEQFATLGSEIIAGYGEGGPVGAAIGGLKGLISSVGGEFVKTTKQIEDSNRELEAALSAHVARMEERRKAATDKGIVDAYDAELARLKLLSAELERQKGIREALAELADAKDAQTDSRSARAGVPQASIDLENITQGLVNQQTALAQQLQDAKEQLTIRAAESQAAITAYVEKTRGLSETVAQKTEEFARMQEAMAKVAEGQKDYDAIQQALEIRGEAAIVKTVTEAEQVFARAETEIGATVAAQAQEAINLLEGIKTQAGGELSRKASDVLQQLYQIIADNIPDAQQADDLKNQMSLLRSSTEGMNRAVFETVTKIMDGFTTLEASYQKVAGTLAAQMNRIEATDRLLNEVEKRANTPAGHR